MCASPLHKNARASLLNIMLPVTKTGAPGLSGRNNWLSTLVALISANVPDWTRETPRGLWDPGRKLLKTVRDYKRLNGAKGPLTIIRRKLIALRHRFWSVITGCEIHLGADIGGGLQLPHPQGIIIHPGARIGPNCMIMHQVTLGTRETGSGAPVVAGHVDIGAGAKVLGGVSIGEHAKIGANAVVLCDVPANAVAAGVPARIIRHGEHVHAREDAGSAI